MKETPPSFYYPLYHTHASTRCDGFLISRKPIPGPIDVKEKAVTGARSFNHSATYRSGETMADAGIAAPDVPVRKKSVQSRQPRFGKRRIFSKVFADACNDGFGNLVLIALIVEFLFFFRI